MPNVVYSCGSMLHGEWVVIPYGYADVGAGRGPRAASTTCSPR